jgi:hypothetical protein
VSANACKLMAKACEMFVLELTMQAYQSKTDAADAVLKVNMTKLNDEHDSS